METEKINSRNRAMRLACAIPVYVTLVLLFFPAAHAIPQPTNISVDPDPNPYFKENRTYFFNISWRGQNITNVTIEHNFTGSLANYSMALGGGIYIYNISNLTPANYVWRVYALNDSNGFNATPVQNYTIRKGIPMIQLLVNGSLENITSFEPNVPINITVDLFSGITDVPNGDLESLRPDNKSLPWSWFFKNSDEFEDMDNLPWPYYPMVNDSFSGSRALFVNVTLLTYYGSWFASRAIKVDSSTNYTLLFHVKNVTFEDPDETGTIYMLEFDESGTKIQTPFWTDIVLFNATDAYSENDLFIVNQRDVGDGWREITVKFTTSPDGRYIKIEPYYFAYGGTTEYYILDDLVLLSETNRMNKTVSINTTFPGYVQQNGSSPLTNITRTSSVVGIHNVTASFLGDANYSAWNKTHVVAVGHPSAVAITTNASFQQGTATGNKVYIPFQVRYTNATDSTQVIAGATCRVSNNQSSDAVTLTFNATTGNHTCTTQCMDNYLLYGNVQFTASCSGNLTFASKLNSTVSDVIFKSYLWELPNQTYGESAQNNTKWLRYNRPAQPGPINISKSISVAVNSSNDFTTFILEDNSNAPSRGLDRTITFVGDVTLRANVSVSNTACMPKLCFQIQDSLLNPLLTRCSPQNISENVATLVEQNVTANATADANGYIALLVRCDANATLENVTETNMTLFYNYSSPPNMETKNAVANPVKAVVVRQVQNEVNYTVGPGSAVNASFNETIEFNNTISQTQTFVYSMLPKTASADRILNTSIEVFSRSGAKLLHTFSGSVIKWTTERLPGNRKTNETVKYTVINAIQDNETMVFQKIGESIWKINVSSNLAPQVSVRNVTAYTNYSAYGALGGWTFNVTITNGSGTFDISGNVTKSGVYLTFPRTDLSSVLYRVNATGIATGSACSNDNQCATGVCCSGTCAAACVTTTTVTVGGGGGGVSVFELPDASIQTPKSFGVLIGGREGFVVNVSNTIKNSKLHNTTIHVSGYLPGYISTEPEKIRLIGFNETRQFSVIVDAPGFITERSFTLNISVKSVFERFGATKNITKTSETKLVINTAAKVPLNLSLGKANSALGEMQLAGFNTERISSLIKELKFSVSEENLLRSQAIIDEIVSLKEKAFSISGAIKEVEKQIAYAKSNGLEIPSTDRFYSLAVAAFYREDYEKAEHRINSALLSVLTETKGRINLAVFVAQNWPFVLASIVLLLFMGVNAYRHISLYLINRKLIRLIKEEAALRELSANLDKEYYENQELSKGEFRELKLRFEERMSKIKSRSVRLVEKKAGLIKAENELKQLTKEHETLLGMVKDLQKGYFEEKKIPKSAYTTRLKEYKSRLSEIAEHIEIVNAKMSQETTTERIRGSVFRIMSIRGVIR